MTYVTIKKTNGASLHFSIDSDSLTEVMEQLKKTMEEYSSKEELVILIEH